MRTTAQSIARLRTRLKTCAKLIAALACCAAVAVGLFFSSLRLVFRNFCIMGCGAPEPLGPLDVLGVVLLASTLVVFPIGARLVRGVVRREVPRRWQHVVLLGFALFPVPAAFLAHPATGAYEQARQWLAAERQRHEEERRSEAASVSAFRAAPIRAEVLRARLVEEHETAAPDHGAGTLELTIRVQNAPPVVARYQLALLDLAEREVAGRARSRLPLESPYTMGRHGRGESGLVTVRNEDGRWRFVEDGTSRVLDSGTDTFTIRLRYAKRWPGLGPPRGVFLSVFVPNRPERSRSGPDRLYLAVPFPAFS